MAVWLLVDGLSCDDSSTKDTGSCNPRKCLVRLVRLPAAWNCDIMHGNDHPHGGNCLADAALFQDFHSQGQLDKTLSSEVHIHIRHTVRHAMALQDINLTHVFPKLPINASFAKPIDSSTENITLRILSRKSFSRRPECRYRGAVWGSACLLWPFLKSQRFGAGYAPTRRMRRKSVLVR